MVEESGEDRSAFSSVDHGHKKRSELLVLDIDNEDLSAKNSEAAEEEEESKNIGDERQPYEGFPEDSDKEEENDDGSEGIDEGFL